MNKKLADKIIKNLSSDLLRPMFKNQKKPLSGHCYVASEVYYHLSKEELKIFVMKHEGVNHWFLKNKTEIIDLTADQFDTKPDYEKAKSIGFLTKQPSKRAKMLIQKVLNEKN